LSVKQDLLELPVRAKFEKHEGLFIVTNKGNMSILELTENLQENQLFREITNLKLLNYFG
jgi:hypothetical protein